MQRRQAPSTLTRNLARLEASGLVERQADVEDARSARVGLTGAGKRAARTVEALLHGLEVLEDQLGVDGLDVRRG